MTPIYGSVWSREYIDAHPLPVVRKDLLPWLIKDRREADEGAMVKITNKDGKTETVHNGIGLKKADQSLRAAKRALAATKDTKEIAFLTMQLGGAESKVEFYAGKMYLLDKVIAATQAS